MGAEGSVAWMFERKSQIVVEKDKADEDTLMTLVLEAGAEEVLADDITRQVKQGLSAEPGVYLQAV